MMSFVAPAPIARLGRFAEDADIVQFWIPDVASLHLKEDLLECHDSGSLEIPTVTEGGGK